MYHEAYFAQSFGEVFKIRVLLVSTFGTELYGDMPREDSAEADLLSPYPRSQHGVA